ncbi:MAG: DUF4833 domain-containing protein [Elusimicrobiota bacterium]|jgi:hypothetical protein|nr:DUF4833 domain-containing protein [Elusimicrobiota bacterium]
MKKFYSVLCVVFVLFLALEIANAASKELFKIERSLNANIVEYDVVLNDDGTINAKDPIDAYWVLLAKNGQREELSIFQKQAYGYSVKKDANGNYTLTLKPKQVKNKPITIVFVNGQPKAKVDINGKPAYLSRVYVATKGSMSVDYIRLDGQDIASGQNVEERISGD